MLIIVFDLYYILRSKRQLFCKNINFVIFKKPKNSYEALSKGGMYALQPSAREGVSAGAQPEKSLLSLRWNIYFHNCPIVTLQKNIQITEGNIE
jgi:hypothetical protein